MGRRGEVLRQSTTAATRKESTLEYRSQSTQGCLRGSTQPTITTKISLQVTQQPPNKCPQLEGCTTPPPTTLWAASTTSLVTQIPARTQCRTSRLVLREGQAMGISCEIQARMTSFGFGTSGGLDQASLSQYAAMGGHPGYDVYKGDAAMQLWEAW